MLGQLRPILATVVLAAGLSFAPTAHAQLSTLLERCGAADISPHETINFCQRALAKGGLATETEAQVHTNLGIGFFELGQYSDAVAEYNRALSAVPTFAAALINRARSFERLGRLNEAGADYAAVLSRNPKDWSALLARGQMLLNHRDPFGAERDFSAALRIAPDLVDAYFSRGIARYELGMWQDAAADFSRVIATYPGDAEAYLNRAQSRAAGGDGAAVSDYDQAVSLAPEWARAWFARGAFHESRGDREQANRDFLRAYELGFQDPWLNERVRQITG